MHLLKAFGLVALTMLTSSCALPQKMPAAHYDVVVVDRETRTPLAGATVELAYHDVSEGRRVATVTTDAEGKASIDAPRMSLPMGFGDAYFAGGYLRHIQATFEGYESYGYTEGPNGFGSTFEMKLTQIRNRFGAVRVVALAEDSEEARVRVTFEMLDGPRAGAQFVLRMYEGRRSEYEVGTKFYLTQPLERYQRYAGSGQSYGVDRFRKAVRDEPYAPTVE